MTVSKFLGIIKDKKEVVIYGAGLAGKIVQEFLQANHISVNAFVTTVAKGQEYVNGLPVYGLEDILEQRGNIFIIVAVMKLTQPDLIKNLAERNYKNYVVATEAIIYEMRNVVYAKRAEAAYKRDRGQASEQSVGYIYPGYMDTDYAEHRLIINKIDNTEYIRLPKELAHFPCIGTEYETQMESYKMLVEASYCPKEYVPDVSYIHTFNMICKTDIDWCVSFETLLPRLPQMSDGNYRDRLVECIKKPNCKALFALCQNAYQIQENSLKSFLPDQDVKLLMQKTKVLHPPQSTLVSLEEIERKTEELSTISFIFIGRDFFFKGGKQIIDVLSTMEEKYNFKLVLISAMKYNDFFIHTPYEEMIKYKKIVQEKKWIEYYDSLSNEKVLELCRTSMVGLLPSMADTYGYAVLEMQAAGCPVVTTNIRAFPELNSNECGWICNIPIDQNGICSEHDMETLSNILKHELEKVFENIFQNPEQIRTKGKMALQRIVDMHDPIRYAECIKEIMG